MSSKKLLKGKDYLVSEYITNLLMYLEAIRRPDHVIPDGFPYCQRKLVILSYFLTKEIEGCSEDFLGHFVEDCKANNRNLSVLYFADSLKEYLASKTIEKNESSEGETNEVV